MDQEQIIQIQMMEQKVNQFNYQLELIDQNLVELEDLSLSLNEIGKKETKNILANLGKKIYLPVEISDKRLLVEVGNKHFVKKSVDETLKIVYGQTQKLIAAKAEILNRLEDLNNEIENLMQKMQDK